MVPRTIPRSGTDMVTRLIQLAAVDLLPREMRELYGYWWSPLQRGALGFAASGIVRAAAKNHESVGIVTDPAQYDAVMLELGHGGGLTQDMRRELAAAAFRLTAAYDGLIADTLSRRWWKRIELPGRLSLDLPRVQELRYGENPHQSAALYVASGVDLAPGTFSNGPLLQQGKPLSYNNILDAASMGAQAEPEAAPAASAPARSTRSRNGSGTGSRSRAKADDAADEATEAAEAASA